MDNRKKGILCGNFKDGTNKAMERRELLEHQVLVGIKRIKLTFEGLELIF